MMMVALNGSVAHGARVLWVTPAPPMRTPTPTRDRPALIQRHPWLMACAFGLVHGLGFAGALSEVGLPQQEIPLALLSFNVGIELGQLLFVSGMALVVVIASRPLGRLPAWTRKIPAYAIGSCAAFWSLERLEDMF